MTRCKTFYPAKGWLTVVWPREDHRAYYGLCSSTEVGEIPGCRLTDFSLEVPYTAWMLEPVLTLLAELDAQLPWDDPAVDHTFDIELPAEWNGRVLYEHQLSGAAFALSRRGTLIADEMGLGKTTTAAIAAEIARQEYAPRPVLIVGTLAVQNTWRSELCKLGLLESIRSTDFCALESRDIDNEAFWRGAKYYFTHYEIINAWWSVLRQTKPCAVILDEAHYIKNSRTQRSSGAALATGGANKRILLTGTPLENDAKDLWHPLTVASGSKTWGYFSDFRKRYCGAEHDGYKLVDTGPTNIAELRQRLQSVFLRRTTADAGVELPEFVRSMQTCGLGVHRNEYDDVAASLEEDGTLGGLESLVRAIAEGLVQKVLPELTRLRQITARAKIPATREFVRNALEQDEAVVVFAWEREVVEEIYAGLGSYKRFVAHGGANQASRDKMIGQFQESKSPSVMLATYGALREGVTLHRARICVLHDLDWVLSSMLQAEKRVHRLGQKRNCQSVWMLAEQSMDTLIAPILLRKAEVMLKVLGIKHDIRNEAGLTELVGRKAADELITQAFAAWDGAAP